MKSTEDYRKELLIALRDLGRAQDRAAAALESIPYMIFMGALILVGVARC